MSEVFVSMRQLVLLVRVCYSFSAAHENCEKYLEKERGINSIETVLYSILLMHENSCAQDTAENRNERKELKRGKPRKTYIHRILNTNPICKKLDLSYSGQSMKCW